jgi:thiol-disulfide isomerase/thioredoxin
MKRNLLLTLSLCVMAFCSYAQLAPGSDFSGNVTGTDVNTGEAVDVQAWLDDGKVVVVDLFATWCPPCWTFHTSGYLEEMNALYGPEGTDQVRILGVEADASTAESLLFGAVSGTSAATTSLGDWTTNAATGEPLEYSLIQNPAATNALAFR